MTFTDNCIVPDLTGNHDGYIRVRVGPRCEGKKIMLHRLEWEKVNGPIPKGYEVNHKCKNRACSNVNHLEVLTTKEHRSKDGKIKHKDRIAGILIAHLKDPTKTQTQLAEDFGVTPSCVCITLNRNNYYG